MMRVTHCFLSQEVKAKENEEDERHVEKKSEEEEQTEKEAGEAWERLQTWVRWETG